MIVVLISSAGIGSARITARAVPHARTGGAVAVTDVSATVKGTVTSRTRTFYYFTYVASETITWVSPSTSVA
jgi:hypothetical protein